MKISIYTTTINAKVLLELASLKVYGKLIALLGQAASQARHSMHASARATTAFPLTISITLAGQTSAQVAAPLHFFVSTIGGTFTPLFVV